MIDTFGVPSSYRKRKFEGTFYWRLVLFCVILTNSYSFSFLSSISSVSSELSLNSFGNHWNTSIVLSDSHFELIILHFVSSLVHSHFHYILPCVHRATRPIAASNREYKLCFTRPNQYARTGYNKLAIRHLCSISR